MYHQETTRDGKIGKRITKGTRGWGVGPVALAVVLIVAIAACGEAGGETPASAPTSTATLAHTVETPTSSPESKATQVAVPSTLTPTPSPAPKVELTSSRYTEAAEPPPGQLWLKGTITGVLTYEGNAAIPAGSQVRMRVKGPNDKYGAVGLSHSFQALEQFPLPFAFHCNPCEVNDGRKHTVSVRIEGPVDLLRQERDHWKHEFRDTLFLNASNVVGIDEKRFAENIEIPVVPPPTLSGTVVPGEGENVPANASGFVRLLDVSEPDAEPIVLSSRLIEEAAAFPRPFSMTYLPEDVDPQGKYILEVELRRFGGEACRGVYRNRAVYEVITGSDPTHDIQLEIVQVDKWASQEVVYVTGKISLAVQSLSSRRNPANPWRLTIWDTSKYCSLAEVKVDGSTPGDHGYQRAFDFSIAYDPSHIDPSSSYVIQAYHLVLESDYRSSWNSSWLEGEMPIRLTPDNPSSHVEVEVHRVDGIE